MLAVAEGAERIGHGPVDDLEVAAAGELLELHEGEVGLDAGGVAIHHEADRARGGDHGGLGVAVAVCLAEFQSLVPGGLGMRSEEHTSELQSRQYLVCRLLLEKKNNNQHHN